MSELIAALLGVNDVEPDSATRVDVAGLRVAVVHIGDDWYAIADRCSHADESLVAKATCGPTSARSNARSTARRSRCSR